MKEIIILYLISSGLPEAIYMGDTALLACMKAAETYEEPVACEPPASENMPYLSRQMFTSPRPVNRTSEKGL